VAQPGEVFQAQGFTPAGGINPGGLKKAPDRRDCEAKAAPQGIDQIFPPLTKGRLHNFKKSSLVPKLHLRGVSKDDPNDGRLHLRRGRKGGRRHGEADGRVRPELGRHGEEAVGFPSGRGRQSLGHLPLKHDDHPMDRLSRLKETKEKRFTDRIREVGDDDHMAVSFRRTERLKAEAKGVRVAKVEVRRACGAWDKGLDEGRVNLEREHASGYCGQTEGENPMPGADFYREIAGTERRGLNDRLGYAFIAEEVLAQPFAPRRT